MCIIRIARYAGCKHSYSYTDLLHENAIYCANQQVLHEGVSTEQEKCPDCVEKDMRYARTESLMSKRQGNNQSNDDDSNKQVVPLDSKIGAKIVATGELVFVENHFGEETATGGDDSDSSPESAVPGSQEGWQVVQKEDVQGQEIPDDEPVLIPREGKNWEAGGVDDQTALAKAKSLSEAVVDGGKPGADHSGRGRARKSKLVRGAEIDWEGDTRSKGCVGGARGEKDRTLLRNQQGREKETWREPGRGSQPGG